MHFSPRRSRSDVLARVLAIRLGLAKARSADHPSLGSHCFGYFSGKSQIFQKYTPETYFCVRHGEASCAQSSAPTVRSSPRPKVYTLTWSSTTLRCGRIIGLLGWIFNSRTAYVLRNDLDFHPFPVRSPLTAGPSPPAALGPLRGPPVARPGMRWRASAFEEPPQKLDYFEHFFVTFLIKKSPEFSLQNYQKSSQSKGAAPRAVAH